MKVLSLFDGISCGRVALERAGVSVEEYHAYEIEPNAISIGVIGPLYRPADQVIQPYEFGHPVRKSTCLWLKGLPKLKPTKIVDFECIHSNGKSGGYSDSSWVVKDENGKILSYRDPRVLKERSKTYPGIAKAIAEQWSKYLEEDIHKITETGSRRLF